MTKHLSRLPLFALAAALVAAGTAYAVEAGRPDPDAEMNVTVTRAEAQAKAAEMFTRMDVNKDGKLDQADRDARAAQMFDTIDTDKNGQISRTEFAAHHQPPAGDQAGPMMGGPMMGGGMMEGHRMDGAEGGEHRMGHHGRGHHRMGGHGMGMGGGHGRMGMMMARMADADKDGAVSQAEFNTAAMAHFDRADANKDGKVTPEERKVAHEAMRSQMRQATAPAAAPAN